MKIITFDQSKCDNCGACQIMCSLEKKGRFVPKESRIRIETAGGLEAMRAVVCQHCAEPVCLTACMRGIIDKDPITGKVTRRSEDCFRCAACQVMCPVGAAVLDHDINAFVTCDLCGGDPSCVKVCMTHALMYEDVTDVSNDRRNQYAKLSLGNPGTFVVPGMHTNIEIDDTTRWEYVSGVIKDQLKVDIDPTQLAEWSRQLIEAEKEGE